MGNILDNKLQGSNKLTSCDVDYTLLLLCVLAQMLLLVCHSKYGADVVPDSNWDFFTGYNIFCAEESVMFCFIFWRLWKIRKQHKRLGTINLNADLRGTLLREMKINSGSLSLKTYRRLIGTRSAFNVLGDYWVGH